MTRLQVNLIVRHIIRNNPVKRSLLRSWRIVREANRARRRMQRAERVSIIDGANRRIISTSSSIDETLEA
jgi:hypothetical protein